MQGEADSAVLSMPRPSAGCKYVFYRSKHNITAAALVRAAGALSQPFAVTSDVAQLSECDHFRPLTAGRTSGKTSVAFACEVAQAHRMGVHLLPVHESPARSRTRARDACAFNDFWKDGWTPRHLLQGPANVYKQIAIALKAGPWRPAGLALVIKKMAETADGERRPIEVDPEAEDEGLRLMVEAQSVDKMYAPAPLPRPAVHEGGRASQPPLLSQPSHLEELSVRDMPRLTKMRSSLRETLIGSMKRRSTTNAAQPGSLGRSKRNMWTSRGSAEAPPSTQRAAATRTEGQQQCCHGERRKGGSVGSSGGGSGSGGGNDSGGGSRSGDSGSGGSGGRRDGSDDGGGGRGGGRGGARRDEPSSGAEPEAQSVGMYESYVSRPDRAGAMHEDADEGTIQMV